MKSFIIYGKKFTPFRNFTKEENAAGLRVAGKATGISNYKGDDHRVRNDVSSDWNYKKFYEKADKIKKVDIFLMDGKEVVPCSNELFYLAKEFQTI